ncbi:MAG: hypothetical protein HQL53_13700 [Magnetococcales bacterium]|nr:hypothetical protein [Magnetococcales bacterium]
MFRQISFKTQILILFLFVAVSGVVGGAISLGVLSQRDLLLGDVKNSHLPLSNIIAEMSAQQTTQVLRYNEILLFARTGNRERLEISNEAFINAGKQFVNIVIEGENIAQKGVELARSGAERKTYDQIKTQLSEMEKAHTDLQYQSSIIVRSIYQHEFLNKNSNSSAAVLPDDAGHHMFIEKAFSRLEDDINKVENLLKTLRRMTESLPEPTFHEAKNLSRWAWSGTLPLLVVSLFGGLGLLVMIWNSWDRNRKEEKNVLRSHTSGIHDLLQALIASSREADVAQQEIAGNQEHQIAIVSDMLSKGASESESGLEVDPRQTTSEALIFADNTRQAAEVIVQRMEDLRKSVRESGQAAEELQKMGEKLSHLSIQIGVLSTNASAEATRDQANAGFALYTDELRALAKQSEETTQLFGNLLVHLVRISQENMEATRYAESRAEEVHVNTGKVKERTQSVNKTVQDQTRRLQAFSVSLSSLVDDMMSQHQSLTEAHSASEKSVKLAESSMTQVQSLGRFVGDRRMFSRGSKHADEEGQQGTPSPSESGGDSGGS